MIKKIGLFSLIALITLLVPRMREVSSAYNETNNPASFSLSSNNNFCVGQTPTYSISGGPANSTATWVSYSPRGQSQTTITLNANGSFSGNGNIWQTSDIGSWTKLAAINGTSKTLQFQVTNCGGNSTTTNITNSNLPGNTYYDPYNNNILQPIGNNNSSGGNYMAPGNTYYDPYNDNIFQSFNGNNNFGNTTLPTNSSYMAPGNTYYDPYGPVPCIDIRC